MYFQREEGINLLFYEKNLDDYSCLTAGFLSRAMGHRLKIALVNSKYSFKFSNFLENLSLSSTFSKELNKFYLESFLFKKNGMISKSIMPQVEFHSLNLEMFWRDLDKFDIVIFDNLDFDFFDENEFNMFLKSKKEHQSVIVSTSNKIIFDKISENFNEKYDLNKKSLRTLISNKNIMSVFNSRFSEVYSIGYLLKDFILKKNVKLIAFDKGGDFWGEFKFFKAMKKWSLKENFLYGTFDFVQTGVLNEDNLTSESKNWSNSDKKEALEGLILLETALKKQTPVIAVKLIDCVNFGLIDEKDVLETLQSVENELVVSGGFDNESINDVSNDKIKFKKDKLKDRTQYVKGIDF